MKAKSILALVMAFLLAFGAGIGTMAFYQSTFTGTGTIQSANWDITSDDITLGQEYASMAEFQLSDFKPGDSISIPLEISADTNVDFDIEVTVEGTEALFTEQDSIATPIVGELTTGGGVLDFNFSAGAAIAYYDGVAGANVMSLTVSWPTGSSTDSNDDGVSDDAEFAGLSGDVLVTVVVSQETIENVFYNQDFENTYSEVQSYMSDLTVTNGVMSVATVTEPGTSSGMYTRFGGYSDVWSGPYTTEMDVYLDPSWEVGEGFDYTVASNGADGNHKRDFIFHATKNDTGLDVWATNNSNFEPGAPGSENSVVITEAGWYTLQHNFYMQDGYLHVDMNVVDSEGSVVFSETRANNTDVEAIVGGNRYGWICYTTVDGGLQIDNIVGYYE